MLFCRYMFEKYESYTFFTYLLKSFGIVKVKIHSYIFKTLFLLNNIFNYAKGGYTSTNILVN